MKISKETLSFFKTLSEEAVVLPNMEFDIYSDEIDHAKELETAGMIWIKNGNTDKPTATFTKAGIEYIEANFTEDFES